MKQLFKAEQQLAAEKERSKEWFDQLVAERNETNTSTAKDRKLIVDLREQLEAHVEHAKELTRLHSAERQRREQAEKQVRILTNAHGMTMEKLLSAQAAIEKHNKDLEDHECWGKITVDLSLLHQHDAGPDAEI